MNYIVFDLEWNQCPGGKERENPRIPFEIIEIGAVKLTEKLTQIGTFHEVIKPLVYHRLHWRMREVVPITEEEFSHARTFSRVVKDFISWCGDDDYTFVTWGNMDLNELQRNMDYYRIPNTFKKPLLYFDLQKMYSLRYDDGKSKKSLGDAVQELGISSDMDFHRAFEDAYYTSRVMQEMDLKPVKHYVSVDYHRPPETREEEINLDFKTYTKYVSPLFDSKDEAMADKNVRMMKCYKCRLPVWRRVKWYSVGNNMYLSLVQCPRHGYVKGKIRIKKGPGDKVFAVRTIKAADDDAVKAIYEKRDQIRQKRKDIKKRKKKPGNANTAPAENNSIETESSEA